MHDDPIIPTITDDRGAGLRDRRLAAALTVSQLAGLACCATATIERIEGGYRPKASPTLTRIYAVLDSLQASTPSSED